MAKVGRPSSYTQEIGDKIIERLCDGESLREICSDDDIPNRAAVFRWLAKEEYAEFRDQYMRAREAQADSIFDDMLSIADDATNDWMERKGKDGEDAGWVVNGDHVRRSAIRLDTRKWILGKMAPKKYSDKIDVNHSGGVTINRVMGIGRDTDTE